MMSEVVNKLIHSPLLVQALTQTSPEATFRT